MTESENTLPLEIGHVLFIDMVGYSKLMIDEQKKWLRQLTELVLATPQVTKSSEEQLVKLPTGDGMALVFRNSSEEPVRCALEIAQTLKRHREIAVRMGIHSGPVSEVTDVSGRTNIAGPGINIAQRVMDCGDTGHILVSKRTANDLGQYSHWRPYLYDLGECEVKHGVRLGVVNLYRDGIGNRQLPAKFLAFKKQRVRRRVMAAALLFILLAVAACVFILRKPARGMLNAPEKSIAVLPLTNESADKDQEYFSDGLSEDLITALSQFAGLKVINRDSSFRFRDRKFSVQEIGAQLGVAHLLEGSVRKLGDEVRVSAELVNVSDGSTLWSQRYDRPYKDLFALQDDITKSVSEALRAKLLTTPGAVPQSDRPPHGDLAAYNAYQQGQFYFQRGSEADLREAIAQFNEATRLDSNYAAAYAASAYTYTILAGYFLTIADKPQAYAEARSKAETALQLDSDLAAAHLSKAGVLLNADLNWIAAYAETRRAVELAPGSPDACFDLSTREANSGQLASAVEQVKQALVRNPLKAFWYDWLAAYLGGLGRLDEAESAAQKSVMLAPQQPLSYRELTYIEVLKGNAGAALAAAQKVPSGRNQDIALAWAEQLSSDHAAADAALKNLIDKHAGDSSYQIAEVYALRRDPDEMFQWLERDWTNRGSGLQYLLYDPPILHYQHDARFTPFCKKIGLPATTDAKAMP